MKISITYEPNAKELANASFLFIENRPFIRFTIGFINIFAYLILFILLFELYHNHEWLPNEALAFAGVLFWLWIRRPLTRLILRLRMKSYYLLNMPLTIDVSLNGIAWSGKRVKSESLTWDQVKSVLESKNGFVIPNAFSKFLWIPFRGFQSQQDIEAFRQMLRDKSVAIKTFPKWD